MISLNNISKNYPNKRILNEFTMSFADGSFTCILGPSGCGKSTLLKLIAGLEKPESGQINNTQTLRTSFVFQDAALIPWLNVKENILIALSAEKNLSKDVKNNKLQDVLSLVKLTGNETAFPHQLSGGMKMRVSIARALINDPQILLMDEPFSALDELVRFELQEELWHLWKQRKMNIFFVTHAISEAVFLAEQILLFKNEKILNLANPLDSGRDNSLRSNTSYQEQIQMVTKKVRGDAHV